jgi:photosystem II PsbZ protein
MAQNQIHWNLLSIECTVLTAPRKNVARGAISDSLTTEGVSTLTDIHLQYAVVNPSKPRAIALAVWGSANLYDDLAGRITGMTIIFNVFLFALVALSFVMVVGVPVAYASPQNWDQSKGLLFIGSGVWVALVVAVGVLNYFVV